MGAHHNDYDNDTFAEWRFGMTPLDIDAAALVLSHPGFFRVAGFALVECCNSTADSTSCRDLPYDEKSAYSLYIPAGDLYNDNGQSLNDSQDAAQWVQDQINKIV